MGEKNIYIIKNQASVTESSPINMDGSEYVIGYAIVPAKSENEARRRFDEMLLEDHMTLMKLMSFELYNGDKATLPSEFADDLLHSMRVALSRDIVYYCGIDSSEMQREEQRDGKEHEI